MAPEKTYQRLVALTEEGQKILEDVRRGVRTGQEDIEVRLEDAAIIAQEGVAAGHLGLIEETEENILTFMEEYRRPLA